MRIYTMFGASGGRTIFEKVRTMICTSALVLASAFAVAGSSTTSSYQLPVLGWMHAYVDYFSAHGLELGATFEAPSIWLFSPNGAMTQMVTVANDPDLTKLTADFPFDADTKQLAGMPSLAQMRELLHQALGTDALPPVEGGVWSAVLFLSDSPGCKHCAAYDKELGALEQRHSAQLRVVRVTAKL